MRAPDRGRVDARTLTWVAIACAGALGLLLLTLSRWMPETSGPQAAIGVCWLALAVTCVIVGLKALRRWSLLTGVMGIVVGSSALVGYIPLLHNRFEDARLDRRDSAEAVRGEVFLDRPDARVRVSCGPELARELRQLIDSGIPTTDRKDQGWAALTIVYRLRADEALEITDQGLIRRRGKVVQVDKAQLLELLKRMSNDGQQHPTTCP